MDTDDRFGLPLYSVPEAAGCLGVPMSTFATWAYGYVRKPPGRSEVRGDPLVAAIRAETVGAAAIPFVGLAEGMMLAPIRQAGVALQRIRPALARLRDTFGLDHVHASRSLYTDGAEVLYDFAERAGATRPRHAVRASSSPFEGVSTCSPA